MNEENVPDFIQKKIDEITKFTDSRIPVLLIGPTGCGKTTIAEKIFEETGGFIKFNFSSETTIDQLLGNLTLDKDSNPHFQSGPYTEAFSKGKSLILDEFNLAHEDVLQCIESSLDTEELYVDDPDLNNNPLKMHEDFKLIATQNDSDSAFASMRNKLTSKLTSHFQVIQFDNFHEEELTYLCSRFNKHISNDIIKQVIEFHYSCAADCNRDYDFTVRNLKMALLSVDYPQDLYRSLLYYYESLLGLEKSGIIANKLNENNIYPNNELELDVNKIIKEKQIQKVWKNDVLTNILRKMQFFMENNQPILLVGPDGSGKTQIAKWASQLFSENGYYFMICHPEMTASDIVGYYRPSKDIYPEWCDGPIIKSAKEGKVLIIDQLENAHPQVIERINPILDAYSNVLLNKKTGSNNSIEFSVAEHIEQYRVKITDQFKIIATVSKQQLKNLSPALKNRFTIIELDSQIDSSKAQVQIEELINALLETKHENQISFSQDLINRIISADKTHNISNISKIVNGLRIICTKYNQFNTEGGHQAIFEVLKAIYIDHKTPKVHNEIVRVILESIKGPIENFYFRGAPELENIIALIIMMQNIGQPIVLQSGTGFGKTSAAVSLANGLDFNTFKVSFNAETTLSDLIGGIIINHGKSDDSKGQLLKAIQEGGFFIADEANLAENSVLQSLIIALEQKPGEYIEIPSAGTIKIHKKYFFIACQNDSTMMGRKQLPQVLLKRVVCFNYPFPSKSNLSKVIEEITKEYAMLNIKDYLVNYVNNINEEFLKNDKIRPWSFREVRRLCRRVKYSYNEGVIQFFQNIGQVEYLNYQMLAIIHALFMSWMMCPDPEKSTETICQIVGDSFNYNVQNLKVLLESDALPMEKYIVKGFLRVKSVVKVNNNINEIPQSIPSFWNAAFFASLLPPTDPLLIVGDSSFKTFLANSISIDPSQVSLGSETTTASLIGQVSYVKQETYDKTMLDLLHTIMISNHQKLYQEFTDFKKNFVRDKNHLDQLQNYAKQIDVPFLDKNIKYITKKLVADATDESMINPALGNYTTIFKPGLITHYLFRQSPIIIRNFSKPSVAVIERFNELLSIDPELTLTEDSTNTITPPDDKVIRLNSPNSRFRIIATSSLREFNKISEAMRSRFNIVNIKPYTNQEKHIITGLSDIYVNNSEFHIHKLILMKTIIDRIKTINNTILKSSQEIPQKELEKQAERILGTVDNEREEYKTPLRIDAGFLKSDNPYIFSFAANDVEPTKTNIVFTKTTQTMCDRIFTAFALDIPIIIQGPTGTCKSMLAEYVASMMDDFAKNKRVVRIQLSRSTTVEDLFGRNSLKADSSEDNGNKSFDYIKTELFEAATSYTRSLIIIEELNLASPSLIDSLACLFDNNPKSLIMKTNGESEKKGKFSIIGIASGNVDPALKKSSIFFQRGQYDEDEMKAVCTAILKENNEIRGLADQHDEYFDQLVKYFETKNPRNCLIYSQLWGTFKGPQNKQLLQEITSKDRRGKQMTNLNQEWNNIEIALSSNLLKISVGKEDLLIPISSTNNRSYEKDLLALTPSEEKLFVCLAANTIKRYPLIVTGGTASGKTYTVRLFAKAINKKLVVIPVNADTSISTITGSYKPSQNVTPANIKRIRKKLNEDPAFYDLCQNFVTDPLKVNKLKDLEAEIEKIINNTDNINTIQIGFEAIAIVQTASRLINNMEYYESPLITAMKNGDWVLFDGVESCPSNVMERIITLLDFEPTLNLYEADENITFTSYASENQIHADFRIILTYNNVGTHRQSPLPQTILSRCAILNMDPIDKDPKTIAKLLIFNDNIPDIEYKIQKNYVDKIDISIRLGTCHCEAREMLKDENPNGSSYELTGRTLSRICKLIYESFYARREINFEQLKSILMVTYNKDINDPEDSDFNQQIFDSFLKDIDEKFSAELMQLYQKVKIKLKKLMETIKENVQSDSPMSNIFYQLERAYFEDLFKLVDFFEEMLKLLEDPEQMNKPNRIIDYIYLKKFTEIIKKLKSSKIMVNDEISRKIKKLSLTLSNLSILDEILKDSTEDHQKLTKLLAEFKFIYQTYPTYGAVLPKKFDSMKPVLDSISDEDKLNIFRYPNLYFNVPNISEISKLFDGIYKKLFDAYVICFENHNNILLKSLNNFTSIIIKNENLLPSKLVNESDIIESLKDSAIELINCFKNKSSGLPEEFINMLKHIQKEYDKLKIDSRDERRWYQLKEAYPDLTSLFDLTESIGWIPACYNQEEIINQAQLFKPISYDKLASNITKPDFDNTKHVNLEWFKVLMDLSSDLYHYDNLLNPKSCISSLLALHNREYNIGNILKTYNGISFTIDISSANTLLFDIFNKYLKAMNYADKNLLNVNNLIAEVDKLINQKDLPSVDWYNFILNNNKKYDINLPIRIPYIPKRIISKFCSKQANQDQLSKNLLAEATSKYFNIDDVKSLQKNEDYISYVDQFPAQGLFLIKNPDFLKLLDNSKEVLTYGYLMIRVVSSFKQIIFEADKLTDDMKKALNKTIQELLLDETNKRSIIVSLAMSNPPYYFRHFYTCLLHDSIVQAATYKDHEKYIAQVNMFIGEYLSRCLDQCKPLTEENWTAFINGHTYFLMDPIGEYIRYAMKRHVDILHEKTEKKIITQKAMESSVREINNLLIQLKHAMKYDDPLAYLEYFPKGVVVNSFADYSDCAKSILKQMTKFDWNAISQTINIIPNADKLYNFLKELKPKTTKSFEKEIVLIYIHDWPSNSISFINKNDQQRSVEYTIKPHNNTFMVVPSKFINDLEIKDQLKLFTINISKYAQPKDEVSVKSLVSQWKIFQKELQNDPMGLDEYFKKDTRVIFTTSDQDYTFYDLDRYIRTRDTSTSYLEEFEKNYMKPSYSANPNFPPSKTENIIKDLHLKIKSHHNNIMIYNEAMNDIQKFPKQKFDPPTSKYNKPDLTMKANLVQNIKVDFTLADNSVFNMAAVNVQGDSVVPTFSYIKADVSGILRCIQTTPICIPLSVFGDSSKVNIKFHPTSQDTPIPTYKVNESNINLIFPINDIIQDITFKGSIDINTTKIKYEINASFIDSIVFIDSPGNKFINSNNGIAFDKNFILGDNIPVIPTIPGEKTPIQKILVKNVNSIQQSCPVHLEDNDKTIIFKELNQPKNTRIDGIAFHLYYAPLEKFNVKINTPREVCDRKILFSHISPPYMEFSEKKEIEIGYTYNRYIFLVSFFVRYNDQPRIDINASGSVSLINRKINVQYTDHIVNVRIEVDMKSIAIDRDEKLNLEISIITQEFQWKQEIILKVITEGFKPPIFYSTKFGKCDCFYNDINYNLIYRKNILPHAFYDSDGYGRILTLKQVNALAIVDNKSRFEKFSNDSKNMYLIIYIQENPSLWIPFCDPNNGNIERLIKDMSYADFKGLLDNMKKFFSYTLINAIKSKIKNFHSVDIKSIKDEFMRKFDKLKKDDFQMTIDDTFDISTVKKIHPINEEKILNRLATYQNDLSSRSNKLVVDKETTIVTEFVKDDSSNKLKAGTTRIIQPEEKAELLQEYWKKLHGIEEPKLNLKMVPNTEEFDQNEIIFSKFMSTKDIYEKISQILQRCRKFMLIMSNYKDYKNGFPSDKAENEIKLLYKFYIWSSYKETLKTTPFLTQCLEFNRNFISLYKVLYKSGCQIQNLDIPPNVIADSEQYQSIIKPKQPDFSVEEFREEWREPEKRTPLNITMNLLTPKSKEKPLPVKKQKVEKLYVDSIASVVPKLVPTSNPSSNSCAMHRDVDAYAHLIEHIDEPQNYENLNLDQGHGIKIEDIDMSEDKDLPIDKFIDYATSTAYNIINYNANNAQINTNSQIVLLLDIKSITPDEIRRDELLYFIAFALACSHLGLNFRLVVFADVDFKILEIKKLSEKLQKKHLQITLETFFARRLAADPYVAIQTIISEDVNSPYSFFVFSDGNLLNTTVSNWNGWDRGTNSTITWLVQPPLEYKDPIERQYKRLQENYNNIFYEINTTKEGGFDNCHKFIVAFFKGFSKVNLENRNESIKLKKPIDTPKKDCMFKNQSFNFTNDQFVCVSENLQPSLTRICEVTDCNDFELKSNGSKFGLEVFVKNIEDNFNIGDIFLPNKPMQYIPSEKGSGISMKGFIKFLITDGQDKRIKQEKKAGYVPDYSLFFVIDCTESSSGFLSVKSTILTVFCTLIAFKECGCSITIILATSTGPVAVCINKKKEDIFIEDSPVFCEIYNALTSNNGAKQTAFRFSQALTAAYNIRCRQHEQESILIAITSAHFYQSEMDAVGTCISYLQELKTQTIGVGVGIYPLNISKVFNKSIWSSNPLKIAQCFNKLSQFNTSEALSEGTISFPSFPEKVKIQELDAELNNKNNILSTKLTDLFEKIQVSEIGIGAFMNIENKLVNHATTDPKNHTPYQDGEDVDLGKNEKWNYNILICQLYDAEVNKNQQNRNDDKQITYATLSDKNKRGIVFKIRDLGFKVSISQTYCNCIAEILSGKYHQVWVICSCGQKEKPHSAPVSDKIRKESKKIRGGLDDLDDLDYSHAYQFVLTVEEFRKKGGGVAFMADQGFTFELDYYLKHLKLYNCDVIDENIDKKPEKIPVTMRFDGEDPVKGATLKQAFPKNFKKQSFDFELYKKIANYKYYPYGFHVHSLKEGTTIAGVELPKQNMDYNEIWEFIKPFRPFSLSSGKGLVSGCYYVSPKYSHEGDIIIDGASSRLFIELNEEGILRLVRNMAVCLVNKWRSIAETGHYDDMLPITGVKLPDIPVDKPHPPLKPIDLVFIYDSTESTEKIKNLINYVIEQAIKWFESKNSDVRIALIAFRDEAYANKTRRSRDNNTTDFSDFRPISQVNEILDKVSNTKCQGGLGDGPEDWNSAFNCLNMLKFRNKAAKIVFFITDNGTHHPDFHSRPKDNNPYNLDTVFIDDYDRYSIDDWPEEKPQKVLLEENIKKLYKKDLFWILCPFDWKAYLPMNSLFKRLNKKKCIVLTLESIKQKFEKKQVHFINNVKTVEDQNVLEEIFNEIKIFIDNATML